MKRKRAVFILIDCIVLLLAGCQSSETTVSKKILDVSLEMKAIDGKQRLFSSFGFWILDESLRYRLVAAYGPDGTLDRIRLRQLVPEANISELDDCVHLRVPKGSISEFLLADGWLIALDPKFDSIIQRMTETIRQGRKRLPPVIIPPNL